MKNPVKGSGHRKSILKYRNLVTLSFVFPLAFAFGVTAAAALSAGTANSAAATRPQGPCDIYAAAGAPCVAAHSTTRALYAGYNGPLYQLVRQSDGKTLDIGVVTSGQAPAGDTGGYADAAAQDMFCANTVCWIATLYDQSGHGNNLIQAPRGGFSGPVMGGYNNLPLAGQAPVSIMGHKAYGVFITPGSGLRQNDAKDTAVDDQAEGQYWVIDGRHFNSGCCFDYGNAEIDSRDDGNGTMETTFFGNTPWWYHGSAPGPWIMTDQENNLVGCVNPDKSKLCTTLPIITSRFVTAMAKGEPHHWTTLGGDAQDGNLSVMFDGPRVDATYDPMRKQGAILLGNGGDNSNGSQGTFYEGVMTAAGTFPSDATDQLVQANIVAAKYAVAPVVIAPPSSTSAPPGLQTFVPGTLQTVAVMFTNTSDVPAHAVTLSVTAPKGWRVTASGSKKAEKTFASPVPPGQSVTATFEVQAAMTATNSDMIGKAKWSAGANGKTRSDTATQRIRNVSPVKINEFRVSDGYGSNSTNSFIELYNDSADAVDVSNWTLTIRPTRTAAFSAVTVPEKTRLAPHAFYVFGLSNSGLAVSANAGDGTVFVRSIDGMKPGDDIVIGTGQSAETRKIAAVGTAAGPATTIWQPVPEHPFITVPAGSDNLPVTRTDGISIGDKIALGFGAVFPVVGPVVGPDVEDYEIATVKAVGKPGTQAYVATDAVAGATNIKVTSVSGISAGDTFRLDIDSVGHGIETVKVKSIGSAAKRTSVRTAINPGDSAVTVNTLVGWPTREKLEFSVGEQLNIGTPANLETVTITGVDIATDNTASLRFSPALVRTHINDEDVVEPGSGLELETPLRFAHAANLPFSVRGTGITVVANTAHAHSSNEPVLPIGTGVTLDKPLGQAHPVDSVVRDAEVKSAGYDGHPSQWPSQWYGGPALPLLAASMVLRDANGNLVDSLNFGGLVDPWAAEGYQAESGFEKAGCFAPTPGLPFNWDPASRVMTNVSTGRYPDGHDTDSNCHDFLESASTLLASDAPAQANSLKVDSAAGFRVGQTLYVDTGNRQETVAVSKVGGPGATTLATASAQGATSLQVVNAKPFVQGQTATIRDANGSEEVTIASVGTWSNRLTLSAPLTHTYLSGAEIFGSGLTLVTPLAESHPAGSQIVTDLPTPGAPNRFSQ